MSNAKAHARNLVANWIGHGANLVVLFFLSPFLVHTLGGVEYGIWSLLTVLTGYMGVLDLGIRASTGRHIILHLGRGDRQAVDETVRTALGFFSGLGFVVVSAGLCMGLFFPAVFQSVPQEHYGLIRVLLPLLALNIWFSALEAVFSSILVAHDRFDLARGMDLITLAVRTTATVLALKYGHGIAGLAAVSIGAHVFGLFGNYLFAKRIYPQMTTWPLLLRRERLRELFGYGLAAFVTAISLRVIGQTDLVIAGAGFGVTFVTVYSVGAMLVYYSNGFLAHINVTLFPALQRAVARGEAGSTRWLYLRAGRLGLVFGLLAYVGMAMFAEPFIRLWMFGPEFGDESVRQAALVMSILAASKLPLLFVGASTAVLLAKGHVRLTATLAVAEAMANLGFSLLFTFVFGWGLAGIAAGTLAARLLVGTFIAPWYACTVVDVDRWGYLQRVGGPLVIAGSLFAVFSLVVRQVMPGDTWPSFFAQVATATAGYVAIALWLLIPPADRLRGWQFIWRGTLGREPS